MDYENEISMYPDIIKSINDILLLYKYKFEIFETWHEVKPKLKERFGKEFDILNELAKPDIMVMYGEENLDKVLIIEVKKNPITLKDMAQAKMYGDIFASDHVFLVAPYELRRNIIQYYRENDRIFQYSSNSIMKFVKLDNKNLQIHTAFPVGGDLL